jgi:hypothetical protein
MAAGFQMLCPRLMLLECVMRVGGRGGKPDAHTCMPKTGMDRLERADSKSQAKASRGFDQTKANMVMFKPGFSE